VTADLAHQLVADAEGAERVVTIEVSGAVDDAAARRAGRTIAASALVRASFFGGDPNWGRLLGALGASDVEFDPALVAVAYQGIVVARDGVGVPYDEPDLLDRMTEGPFTVEITIGAGPGTARVLTTDLTPDYVRLNGERS
jgi:glutamate N-acetyltransferase/amino-acid N-acetyltransferase